MTRIRAGQYVVGCLLIAAAFLAPPVSAIGLLPTHDPAQGDNRLCLSTTYACTGAGYGNTAARTSGWPWSYYGGRNASYRGSDPHNCTLYAAFRLSKNKFPDPKKSWGNAGGWYRSFSTSQYNGRPAVGSIAEWNAPVGKTTGHVAYVEAVSAAGITISDDSWGLNTTSKQTIAWNSAHWPNRFIHLKDVGPQWPGDPRGNIVGWRNANGSITSWLVDKSGKRHWIPTTSIYYCLRRKGAKDFGPQPAAILDLLPDQIGNWASCR